MSTMFLRNVDADLMRRAKAHAMLQGITLHDYVVGLIERDLKETEKGTSTQVKAPRK